MSRLVFSKRTPLCVSEHWEFPTDDLAAMRAFADLLGDLRAMNIFYSPLVDFER